MKFRRLVLVTASAAAALTVAAAAPSALAAPAGRALPAGLVQVAQVPNSLGPGWTAVQWVAGPGDGGGCAIPANDSNLAPLVSEPCGEWTFEERQIGTVPGHGPQIELVDPAGQFAVGFSGSLFKMEKPSTSPGGSFLVEAVCSGGHCVDYNSGLTDAAGAAGKGDDLKVSGTYSSAYYWDQF